MSSREYLRAGEVPTLYGENSRQSDYQLWQDLVSNVESDMTEGGIWKGRLSASIMKGICDDHALTPLAALEPQEAAARTGVMPSRGWSMRPSLRTEGKDAVLVVDIRNSTTMRDWSPPDRMPAKALRRYKAVAMAYGVERVVVGVLVYGYTSQMYVVKLDAEEAAEMKAKVDAFLDSVSRKEEPDLDFDKDARQIRAGTTVQRLQASAAEIDALGLERLETVRKLAPVKTQVGQYEQRLIQIDTMLVAMAGTKEKLETPSYVIAIDRNAKGTPKVTVVGKERKSLF